VAINRLRDAAILRPLTDRKRDPESGVILDDIGLRIARASF
jgi:hypothetical protein